MSWESRRAHIPTKRCAFSGFGLTATLATLVPAAIALNSYAWAGDFQVTVTPGVGHDRFTEVFYLDDTTAVSLDSLSRIKKTEDGLRESYGSMGVGLDYGPWQVNTTLYATDAAWRNISYGSGRWRRGRWRTDVSSRLEWKGIDTDDSLATAYTYYRLDVKPRYRIGDEWSALLRGDWEATDYQRNSAYTVDYSRLRGQVGLEFFGTELQNLDAWIGLAHRAVPDSTRLSYTESFVRLDAAGWYLGAWRFRAGFSFANRNYEAATDADDHRRWSASARGSVDWSDAWRFSLFGEWRHWDYQREDEASYDVSDWRFEGTARARLVGEWEFGGMLELRLETPSGEVASDNNYHQWAAGPILFWNPSPYVWSEIIQRIGYRDYGAESLIYDDYTFWELSGQFDLALAAGPNVSLTASYLSESHDDPLGDFDQLYLSVALRVPLRP